MLMTQKLHDNLVVLLSTLETVKEKHLKFDMSDWRVSILGEVFSDPKTQVTNQCDTACCVLGWYATLHPERIHANIDNFYTLGNLEFPRLGIWLFNINWTNSVSAAIRRTKYVLTFPVGEEIDDNILQHETWYCFSGTAIPTRMKKIANGLSR